MATQTVEKKKRGEGVRTIVSALIIAVVLRTFVVQPFSIPSGSMEPTLLIGDYLFVLKFRYGYSHLSLPPAVLAAAFLRPHLGLRAQSRRRRRVPPARAAGNRLHQAHHRPAG